MESAVEVYGSLLKEEFRIKIITSWQNILLKGGISFNEEKQKTDYFEKSLDEQFLSSITAHLFPTLTRRKLETDKDICNLKSRLESKENAVLIHLSEATGSIFEDNSLIILLEEARKVYFELRKSEEYLKTLNNLI